VNLRALHVSTSNCKSIQGLKIRCVDRLSFFAFHFLFHNLSDETVFVTEQDME
jgi:hypothetical protein